MNWAICGFVSFMTGFLLIYYSIMIFIDSRKTIDRVSRRDKELYELEKTKYEPITTGMNFYSQTNSIKEKMENPNKSLTKETKITGDDIALRDMLVQKRPEAEEKKQFCTNCGKEIEKEWKFCRECGNEIK